MCWLAIWSQPVAVGVDGEQDTDAVPGVGPDLGGRGAGGRTTLGIETDTGVVLLSIRVWP